MIRFVALTMVALFAVGCGGGSEQQQTTSNQTSQPPPASSPGGSDGGRSLLDEAKEDSTALASDAASEYKDMVIRPYFDRNGTINQLSATPGDEFMLYVFAEMGGPYQTTAAEYKRVLPEGIKTIGQQECPGFNLDIGDYEFDYMLTYKCKTDQKFYLVVYECVVEENFTGGTVQIAPGDKQGFLGFVNCAENPLKIHKIPAQPGAVVLKRK